MKPTDMPVVRTHGEHDRFGLTNLRNKEIQSMQRCMSMMQPSKDLRTKGCQKGHRSHSRHLKVYVTDRIVGTGKCIEHQKM